MRLCVIVVSVLVLALRIMGVNIAVVEGSSMLPTIQSSDILVVCKARVLHRGDLVVFRRVDGEYLIKRVIGLPEESVGISRGTVSIIDKCHPHGFALKEPYAGGRLLPDDRDGGVFKVPKGYYFVMGDNRPKSLDSRDFGPIPTDQTISRVVLRLPHFAGHRQNN